MSGIHQALYDFFGQVSSDYKDTSSLKKEDLIACKMKNEDLKSKLILMQMETELMRQDYYKSKIGG